MLCNKKLHMIEGGVFCYLRREKVGYFSWTEICGLKKFFQKSIIIVGSYLNESVQTKLTRTKNCKCSGYYGREGIIGR